jgi:hypothetical protein
VAEYVVWRRRLCGDIAIANDLDHLRGALKLICPDTDWSWLLSTIKRIAAMAPRKAGKYHLVTSDRLYLLGIELMDRAVADAQAAERTRTAHAFQYRDGLIIALLALIPLRRRTLAALRIGKHLTKAGDHWALDIPASDTKSGRPLDYPISGEMSARIDVYLNEFRHHIPGADKHTSLWASNQGRPMCADAIYNAVRRRTKGAFGFGVNLHRFRQAGPCKCERQQGSPRSCVVWYDRETLHHGPVASCRSCPRSGRRRVAKVTPDTEPEGRWFNPTPQPN